MIKILVVDDEIKICEAVCDYMGAKGISVETAQNGKTAVEKVCSEEFDLVILDVMMPVKNGIDTCLEIRRTSCVPVLFLSALGEEQDFLNGYKSGGDDYIVKPFPMSVLYEKCMTMIRRCRSLDPDSRITAADIILDKSTMKVYAGKREIVLSSKDFQLLEYLMLNKNIVLGREKILSRIWGYDFDGDDRVVDSHIKIIRKALGEKSGCIRTVIGSGYKFETNLKKTHGG